MLRCRHGRKKWNAHVKVREMLKASFLLWRQGLFAPNIVLSPWVLCKDAWLAVSIWRFRCVIVWAYCHTLIVLLKICLIISWGTKDEGWNSYSQLLSVDLISSNYLSTRRTFSSLYGWHSWKIGNWSKF